MYECMVEPQPSTTNQLLVLLKWICLKSDTSRFHWLKMIQTKFSNFPYNTWTSAEITTFHHVSWRFLTRAWGRILFFSSRGASLPSLGRPKVGKSHGLKDHVHFDVWISGWWLTYPSETWWKVSWDDDIPNIIWKNKKCSKPPTRYVWE